MIEPFQGDQAERKIWVVNLAEKTCTCRRYQDGNVPCGHAMAFIQSLQGQPPIQYMPPYLTRENWIQTYLRNIPPVDITTFVPPTTGNGLSSGLILENHTLDWDSGSSSDSESSLSSLDNLDPCEPPSTRPPRGRPSKKRKHKGDVRGPQALHQNMAAGEAQLASGSASGVEDYPGQPVQVPFGRRKAPHCRTCGGGGHNARTCRQAHE